jgi:hypothetical protein
MITPSFGLTATERVLPKLALDFTTASLDPRVTFTRSGNTATQINSNGLVELVSADTPRFDYTLNTGGLCKGLLIEEARTNLCLQSQDLTTTWQTNLVGSVTANAAISPDGTQNADLIVLTGPGFQYVFQNITVVTGQQYTFSFFIKAATIDNTPIRAYGDFSGVAATNITPTQEWVRRTITFTAVDTSAQVAFAVPSSGAAVGIYVYGAQLETGAFATSYVPTVASQVTRTADVATMTGTNFSSWYSAGAGGAVARVLPSTVSGTRPTMQFDDSTVNEIIALRGNTTNPELVIVDGGSPQSQIDAGTIAANTVYNLGVAWNTDNCAAAVNGGATVTDATATIPTVTQARLGSDGTNYLNGHIQTVRYWPQRIINAEVQAFSKG